MDENLAYALSAILGTAAFLFAACFTVSSIYGYFKKKKKPVEPPNKYLDNLSGWPTLNLTTPLPHACTGPDDCPICEDALRSVQNHEEDCEFAANTRNQYAGSSFESFAKDALVKNEAFLKEMTEDEDFLEMFSEEVKMADPKDKLAAPKPKPKKKSIKPKKRKKPKKSK